jgi:hypothetical protein
MALMFSTHPLLASLSSVDFIHLRGWINVLARFGFQEGFIRPYPQVLIHLRPICYCNSLAFFPQKFVGTAPVFSGIEYHASPLSLHLRS